MGAEVGLLAGFQVQVAGRIAQGFAAVLVAVLLSGCASSLMDGIWGDSNDTSASTASSEALSTGLAPDMTASTENAEVAKLYNAGLDDLNDGQNKAAVKKFSEVERKYPYSSFATKAILMQAYASYTRGKFDDAMIAANRFITLHPGHRDAGYAYYLIAISNYNKIADTKRDQSATRRRWSRWRRWRSASPARPMRRMPRRRSSWRVTTWPARKWRSAAITTGRAAISPASTASSGSSPNFRNTSQTPEALYRLAEGYMALGIVSEAQTAAAVLGYNYPNSDWYKDAYRLVSSDGQAPVENKESWISKTFASLNPLLIRLSPAASTAL